MISEAKITKVEVKDGTGLHTIYDGATGRKTDHKVPIGGTWEIRVTAYAKSDTPLWAVAISVTCAGVPVGYPKPAVHHDKVELAKGLTYVKDFEMSTKLDTRVVPKITWWTSDFYTGQLPPKESW